MTLKNVIEGKFVADDDNATGRIDDSSDEDVGATFDRIRQSLVQNNINNSTETIDKSSKLLLTENINNNRENIESNKKSNFNKRQFLSENSDTDDETILHNNPAVVDGSDEDSSTKKKNRVSIKKKKTLLEDSDEDDIVNNVNINTQLDKSSTENHNLENDDQFKVSMKKKRIFDDSDEDSDKEKNDISMKKKKTSLDDSDEDDILINTNSNSQLDKSATENCDLKENIVSMKKKRAILEDSDEEDEVAIVINSKVPLDDQKESDIDRGSMKIKILESNNILKISVGENFQLNDGNEDNDVSVKEKKTILADSDKEMTSNFYTDLNESKLEKNKRSLENTDSDEEIGVLVKKKNKYLVNVDSD